MSKPENKGKWQVLLMVGIVATVLAAGFLVFPKTGEQRAALLGALGTTNHGELLSPPLPIQALALQKQNGAAWDFARQKPKWRLLIVGDESCSGSCGDMLHLTRQLHKRLGKNAHRLERIYLSGALLKEDLVNRISQDHPYLVVLEADPQVLETWLQQAPHVEKGNALLIDPKGLAMMRYGPGHEGNGMLEDINHLLKYSPGQ